MQDSLSISDAFQVDSKMIKESRQLLMKMLSESADIDYPEKNGQPFGIRFYLMTRNEYELSSGYCFKVVFGDFEAYCYDYRRLLNERYLTFDSEISFLPIVLSGKRWEKINQMYGSQMNKFIKKDPKTKTFVNGIFLWPLYNEERMALFRNSNTKPVLFLKEDSFELKSELNDPKMFSENMKYYDTPPEKRFFPKGAVEEPAQLSPEESKKVEQSWLLMQKKLLDKLTSLNFDQNSWNKFELKAKTLYYSLVNKSDPVQIFSMLLTTFLTEYFDNLQK